MEKIKLNILGITYSQVQQGAYALVLEQDGGPYRIPVVVGLAEAQSIAVKLEGVIPPRPLPHDIMVSAAHAFGIQVDEIFIYKFDEGIFLSELRMSNDDRQIAINCRTSDAIAIALRTGAPIYTTPEVVEQTGFIIPDEQLEDTPKSDEPARPKKTREIANMTTKQLEKMLAHCVESEEYERAAEIKREIDRRREN